VNISVIMAISGHKTMAMFKRYNRIDLSDGRDAMKKLAAFLSGDYSQHQINQEKTGEQKAEEQKREGDYFQITSAVQDEPHALA
jgi:hypothetical protein